VILHPDAEQAWLDSGTPAHALPSLLASLGPSETALQPVGPAVNDARYDGPECLAPPLPDPQAALF
jgi:putative SOS response-associated peptidase YedK